MGTLYDYLKWRGDISFAEVPVNDVDSLIFSLISYIDFKWIVPPSHQGTAIPIQAAANSFFAKHPNPDNFCPEDGGEYGRMDPIYTLTMDVHAGKYAQAEERIMDFRSRGMSSGLMKRHYSIIARSLDLYTCIMYVHCSPTSKRLLSKA